MSRPTPLDLNAAARGRPLLLVTGIVLIAACLRAPFTSAAPLLNPIRESFGLGTTQAGMLTTLPLLAFAAVSPFGARLARAFGFERALFGALLLIMGGIALRSFNAVACLYLGTAVLGGGIAIGNVLLPGLLKRDYPDKIALLTSAYALTMGTAAALGSAVMIPLVNGAGLSWPLALGLLIILPLLAAIGWLPQLRSPRRELVQMAPSRSVKAGAVGDGAARRPAAGRIWSSRLAWLVTLFLGFNSFIYYVIVSWLPAILIAAGYSPAQAGSLHGLMQLTSALAGLLVGPVAGRMRDQRVIALGVSLLCLLALAGLALYPALAVLWTALFGFGSGAAIILGLMFVSLRVHTSHQAAALSGMAQCVGYLLAATGPILIGALRDAAGNWESALLMCAALCLVMAWLGMLAGRNRQIPD
ncbi:MFS transporter [Sodalis sp. RH21]|uniref:MFS transporter n=1 Tax=unclassified Sodalis (in: enterobacteria) TaxID=2636512 RepID=UPI0039B3CE0D